ncbi:MAG: methyltransferase domain-containing protein [Alphaproteobacteria bacterium]|nr:MAG: methyltransferase domain-containing protein [Alphaproteobacteria bacterium]
MQPQALPSVDDLTPDELNAQARECLQRGMFDEAHQLVIASLQKGKTATALRLMGNLLYTRRDMRNAIVSFNEALSLDKHDHASMAMLAEVYFAMGDVACAGYSMMAMTEKPAEFRYKERFVHFANSMAFTEYSPLIENAIVECLKTPGLDCGPLHPLWYNTFSLNPDFRSLYKTYSSADPVSRQKSSGFKRMLGAFTGNAPSGYVFFDAENFKAAKDLKPLLRPFFVLGLKNLLVQSLPFEEFLVCLRTRLLDEAEAPELLPLVAALAGYCFQTRYIFPVTAAEQNKVSALQALLESGAAAGNGWQVCRYACYAPLYRLKNAAAIADALASVPDVADVVRGQVLDYLALQEMADQIPTITRIEPGVSAAVRNQYEEFPYPLWKAKPGNVTDEVAGAPLKKKGAKILVAGCGTGSEAVQAAMAFPESIILGVDLSRTSLAYGALKAREFNLTNIEFAQGDILNLSSIDRTFDGIFSAGVLHHMEDPVKGWKVLTGLLNPGGLMRVSLYSETARQNIVKAHDIIRKGGYAHTAEGMKAFRQDSPRLLPWEVFHEIARAEDYYQLAMYRDMLFHVQEHRFDLLKIRDIMAGLGLKFLRMNVSNSLIEKFRAAYPDDPDGTDLAHWHDFEQKHPDTFICMYQFWCQKT